MANTADAFDSPDTVEMKGRVTGVTRLSKKAKAAVGLVGVGILGFILFSIYTVDSAEPAAAQWEDAQEGPSKLAPAKPGDVVQGVGDGQAGYGLESNLGPGFPVAPESPRVPAPTGKAPVPADPAVPPTPEELAAQRLKDHRLQMREQAMRAELEVAAAGGDQGAAVRPAAADFLKTAAAGVPGATVPPLGGRMEQDDLNKQVRKENFLRDAESQPYQTYLKEAKQPALSRYEVKAGWVIPAALECGINSDLPGQICARVRESVYDSTTGRHLLIPQGTKLIGTYDSQIAYGQERLLAVWNRLIFPDGSSISLQGMPGADQAGYAGFDADVDNHYFKVFGGAILLSVISAGAQLSQPQQSAGTNGAPSAQQTMSAALGQQLGQVGSAMVQRNMQIQPTLTREPGYRFNVMVTRDIIFPGAYKR